MVFNLNPSVFESSLRKRTNSRKFGFLVSFHHILLGKNEINPKRTRTKNHSTCSWNISFKTKPFLPLFCVIPRQNRIRLEINQTRGGWRSSGQNNKWNPDVNLTEQVPETTLSKPLNPQMCRKRADVRHMSYSKPTATNAVQNLPNVIVIVDKLLNLTLYLEKNRCVLSGGDKRQRR